MNAHTSRVSLARVDAPWPPAGTTVIDRRGLTVDISGQVWKLIDSGTTHSIGWDRLQIPDIRVWNAIRRHFAFLVETRSPKSVLNAFRAVETPLQTSAFAEALKTTGIIPFLVFSEAKAAFGAAEEYRLHYWRQLYRWCTHRGFPRFSRDVMRKLNEQTIGGNVKGAAVRSADPGAGPLTAPEIAALVSALRGARADNSIPIAQEAAIWLCLACGANAGQFAAMREDDLIAINSDEAGTLWTIKVPRHKKPGLTHARDQFRTRKLTGYIGRVVAELIEHNRQVRPVDPDDPGGRALFPVKNARFGVNHPMAEWRWHGGTSEFTNLIKRGVFSLDIRSRSGDPLRITTRRLRYTLATRLVASGASQRAVAEALDHTDLQNVTTYFDIDNGIVDQLDAALAIVLAPRAQALMVVAREEDAIRSEEKGSRCYFSDRNANVHEPIGTCGSNSYCNVVGPLACYTCRRFQPWMNGPHREVLDFLIARRLERQEQGLDAKMVAIEDNVIFAVGGVIRRIEEIRSEAANDS